MEIKAKKGTIWLNGRESVVPEKREVWALKICEDKISVLCASGYGSWRQKRYLAVHCSCQVHEG